MYKIGELAKSTGSSNDTLRYYEKLGLISPVERSKSGYRLYDDSAKQALKFIQQAKSVGFSLEGIRELLSLRLDKESHSCAEVKSLTEAKLIDIEDKIAELNRIKAALAKLNTACCGGPESAIHCSILQALETGQSVQKEHHSC